MRRPLAKIAAVIVAAGIVACAAVFLRARAHFERVWDVSAPAIVAATAPEAIARGERIFMAACFDCHVDSETGKASGGRIHGVPGEIHAANITADPAGGIGAVSDGLVARVVRTGIRRDGRLAIGMPPFPQMGDADVAAVLGFLRSSPPPAVLEPIATKRPPPTFSFLQTILASRRIGPAHEGAAKGIAVPSSGSTLEYGRYLSDDVYRCGDCHASSGGEPYVGGAVFEVAGGGKVVAPNLTPSSAHGIGAWTFADFAHAVRDGIAKDGFVLHHPMPRLRLSDDTELGAIYAWLMSRPARDVARPRVDGELARERVAIDAKPAELFLKLGCASCHSKGAPYAVKLRRAKGKPAAEVAAWIRNPQQKVPGTPMPTFATLLTEEQSTQLAEWLLARLDEPGYRF